MSNFVSIENDWEKNRRKNFFLVVYLFWVVWICFHFIVVYLFGFLLSPLMIAVFLGIANLSAMAVDIPAWVIQKYIQPKTLIIIACLCMILVSGIFFYLVYIVGGAQKNVDDDGNLIQELWKFFVSSLPNIFLMILAAVLYGFIKEIYDVSALSYIMNTATPEEYPELISKNNIFGGIGSATGLMLNTIIMAFTGWNALLVILALWFLSIFLSIFVGKYFDRSDTSINMNDIKKFKLLAKHANVENIKKYVSQNIQKDNLIKIAKHVKIILLKPITERKKINFKEITDSCIKEYTSVYETLFSKKFLNRKLLGLLAAIMLFGFWDTFVITFLPEFIQRNLEQISSLKSIAKTLSYPMIGVFAIPIFALQIPFILLSKKIGFFRVISFGLMMSACGILCFMIPGMGLWFLLFGIINSIGYSAGMPLSQAVFSETYNESYAKNYNLTEIDANISAAPLKMAINGANVFGAFGWGLIKAIIGFTGTFIIYGGLLLFIFWLSIVKKKEWGLDA